jgi:hypothetical protein
MKKVVSLFVSLLALSSVISWADIGESTANRFNGVITAIESERDSITVESSEGQVRMFALTSSQKENLSVGQKVSVAYLESYEWPLKTTSISPQ